MKRALFSLLFVCVLLVPSLSVQAADPLCECFCTSSAGATKKGGFTPQTCFETCAEIGERVVACAFTASQYPSTSLSCFTKDQCTQHCEGMAARGNNVECEWDAFQPSECIGGQHYCYPTTKTEYKLEWLGGTTVSDLGDFINTMYTVLIGISITIAIVMVMIGGFQYVLKAGAGDVKEAKQRIKNALVGLVLLLGAVTLLATVNPQLLKLDPPKLPAIKRVEFLGKGSSCEEMKTAGSKIDEAKATLVTNNAYSNQTKVCGSVAPVTAGPNDVDVPDGSTCTYDTCPSPKKCMVNGQASGCFNCIDLKPDNTAGAIPSSDNCGRLARPDVVTREGVQMKNYCFWTRDANAVATSGEISAAVIAGIIPGPLKIVAAVSAADIAPALANGACAELSMFCADIKKCEDYDVQKVTSRGGPNIALDNVQTTTGGDQGIDTICSADPCGVVGKSGGKITGCQYVTTLDVADDCRPILSSDEEQRRLEEQQREREKQQQRFDQSGPKT